MNLRLNLGRRQKIGLRLGALVLFLAIGVAFQNCAPLKCVSAAPAVAAGTAIGSSGNSSGTSSSGTTSTASTSAGADCPKVNAAASTAPAATSSTSGTRAPSSTGGGSYSGGSGTGSVILPPVVNPGSGGGGTSTSGYPTTGGSTGGSGSGSSGPGTPTGIPSTAGLYMFTLDLKDSQISNGVVDSENEYRVNFSVSVQGGYPPLTYKWFKDGAALTTAQVSAGSSITGPSINVDAAIPNVLGEYYVEVRDVTNKLLTSKKVKLTQLNQDCREEYFFALENTTALDTMPAQTYDIAPLINRTKAFYKTTNEVYAVSQRNWFPNQLSPDTDNGAWNTKGLYRGSKKFPAAKYNDAVEFPNCNVYFGKDHHVPVARPDREGKLKRYGEQICSGGVAELSSGLNTSYALPSGCYMKYETIYDCQASSMNVHDQNSACFENGFDENQTTNYTYTGSVKYQCKGNRWQRISDTCAWKW